MPPKKGLNVSHLWIFAFTMVLTMQANAWRSVLYPADWQPPADGQVGYDTNKIIQDFSYAGYRAGEVALPNPVGPLFDVTQAPYNADKTGVLDATVAIQAAINAVQTAGGGVVYLPAGKYSVSPQGANSYALLISSSNLVLRGAGIGQTFLLNTSTNMRSKSIILINGPTALGFYSSGAGSTLIGRDLMGPTRVIPVANTNGFAVGQFVVIRADCTDAWVTEHGEPNWLGYGSALRGVAYFRTVVAVSGVSNTITINAPTRYYLKTRDNARVVRLATAPLQGCGLENFSIGNVQHNGTGWAEDDYNVAGTGGYDVHDSFAIRIIRARDSWVRNVATFQAVGNTTTAQLLSNGILLNETSQLTLTNCDFGHSQYGGAGGNGYQYRLQNANECLLDNCRSTFTRHGFVLSHMASSGNVYHGCTDKDSGRQTGDTGSQGTAGSNSDHHMHFSHGNLVDTSTGDGSGFEARYRPYGSAPLHDLTAAHSVFWNTRGIGSGPSYVVTSEQSRYGYVIGTRGARSGVSLSNYGLGKCDPADHVEGMAQGDTLEPFSLYEDQLRRRLSLPQVTLPGVLTLAFPSNSVQLQPVVEIGGQPAAPNAYMANWRTVSAPGAVWFSDSNAPSPMVTFAARGTNVVELTISANSIESKSTVAVVLGPDNVIATTVITPTADTYVRDGSYANDNYGQETTVQLKKNSAAGYTRRAFFRFNLPGGMGPTNLSRAFLELNALTPPAADTAPTLELHAVTNDAWGETSTSWNTQPVFGSTIASWLMSTSGFERVEVTAVLQGQTATDGTLSLGLLIANPFSDTVYSFYSREAATNLRPRLVMETTVASAAFGNWIASFTNLPPTMTSADSDPDGDGRNNAEEYLFGGNPQQAEGGTFFTISNVSGGRMINFPQRQRLPNGTYYVIENSPTLQLATWQPTASVQFSSASSTGETGVVNAFIPGDLNQQGFYRLRIVLGP